MFIRRKVVKGVTYYAVVENQRPRNEEEKPRHWRTARDGRVKQRTVVSLGRHPTIEAALIDTREWLAFHQHNMEQGLRDHRKGIFLFQDETGRISFHPVGETARKRVDKLERQIAKLESAQAVVSKTVP
jgi:hypothetical protein